MATLTPAATRQPGSAELGGAARHGVANLAGVALAALAGFGLNVVVARSWPIGEAGLFFAASSAFVIAYGATRLGADLGSVYFLSRYRVLGQPERLRAAVLAGLLPVLGLGTVIAVTGWWWSPAVAEALFPQAGPGAVDALRILLVFVPFAAASDVALAACQGFRQMRPLILVERLGRNALQTLAVLGTAGLGLSVTTALPVAWAAPYLPAAAVALVWLALLVRRAERAAAAAGRPAPVSVREQWRPYWRFTGPRALGSLAQMVVQRADIVLLGALRGLSDAAIYTAATRFLALGQLSGQALSTAVQHRLAEHLARDDRAAAGRLYQAATAWLVLLAWPLYLLFAVFAGPTLALFGDGYAAGAMVTVYLALTMLVATGCGAVDAVLNMAGKTTWTFGNALAGTVLNLGMNVLLIPRYGIMGATAAWSTSILLTNLLPLAQLRWRLGLHPFGRGTLVAAALALACFGAPPLVARGLVGDGPGVLAGTAAVGALGYAAAAWRLRGVLQLDALRSLRRRGGGGGPGAA
ncbi:MAG TPA: polysaccharide biosynthesis C-terminal domain-containing protein [Pilimelia sp.]|nr:polysaccharide biosynthesis C-terminal domain-containing protein [Pilimelia sp.]